MENNYHNRPKNRKKIIAGRSVVIVTALLLLLGIRYTESEKNPNQEVNLVQPHDMDTTYSLENDAAADSASRPRSWSQWSRRDKEHYLQTYVNCTRGDAFQLYYSIGLEICNLPDSKIKAFYCPEQEKIIVNEKYLNQESVIRAVYLAIKHASLYHSNLHDL